MKRRHYAKTSLRKGKNNKWLKNGEISENKNMG